MKLEEEIQQTRPFRSEHEKLLVNIHFTSSWLNADFARWLKPLHLTPPQYNVLRILKGRHPEGYCNQQIASRMIDKSSNATRIADKLVDKGFIIRKQQTKDRRLVDIKITEKGLEMLDHIEAIRTSQNSKFKHLTEDEARQMNLLLDQIRD